MKNKNFFRKNLSFTIFGILAVLIVLAAIFAPIVTGGVDPTAGTLQDTCAISSFQKQNEVPPTFHATRPPPL